MTYKIWGKLKGHPTELVDTATSKTDATYMLHEYRMAFGKDWTLWIGKKSEPPGLP